jgi:hypothetical protein
MSVEVIVSSLLRWRCCGCHHLPALVFQTGGKNRRCQEEWKEPARKTWRVLSERCVQRKDGVHRTVSDTAFSK